MPKLDKAGEYIICDELRGAGRCGGRLARVQPEDGRRVMLALPGWERGTDGIWHEPPNDFNRRQRGYRARPLPERLTGTRDRGPSWLAPMFPLGPLPFRCSDCAMTHLIEAATFGLSIAGETSMITETRAR